LRNSIGIVVWPLRVTLMTFRARSMLLAECLLPNEHSYTVRESYSIRESYFERHPWQIVSLAVLAGPSGAPRIASCFTDESSNTA
jgi:hypothetical protein